MTVPLEYNQATDWFNRFLAEAADEANLVTRHQSFTMVEGVLATFGRRLDASQSLRFAQLLPPLLSSLFISTLQPDREPVPFASMSDLTREVQSLRANHNLSPDTAIRNVAAVLRRHLDSAALDAFLATLPSGAKDYWSQRLPRRC